VLRSSTIRLPASTPGGVVQPLTKRSPSCAKRALKPKRWRPARRQRRCVGEDAVRRGCDTILACAAMAPSMKFCRAWLAPPWLWAWCRWAPPTRCSESRPALLSRENGSPAAGREPRARLRGPNFLSGRGGLDALALLHCDCRVGADALFLSRLDPSLKRRLGYLLYLVEGFASGPHIPSRYFKRPLWKRQLPAAVEQISQLLAVRIATSAASSATSPPAPRCTTTACA